jgi:fructoselysine-6-P-deglycase FrlB-like protein
MTCCDISEETYIVASQLIKSISGIVFAIVEQIGKIAKIFFVGIGIPHVIAVFIHYVSACRFDEIDFVVIKSSEVFDEIGALNFAVMG